MKRAVYLNHGAATRRAILLRDTGHNACVFRSVFENCWIVEWK